MGDYKKAEYSCELFVLCCEVYHIVILFLALRKEIGKIVSGNVVKFCFHQSLEGKWVIFLVNRLLSAWLN